MIVAALLIRATDSTVWDLVVAVAIAVFIVVLGIILSNAANRLIKPSEDL